MLLCTRRDAVRVGLHFCVKQDQQLLACPARYREKSPSFGCLAWRTAATVFVATYMVLHLTSMFLLQVVSIFLFCVTLLSELMWLTLVNPTIFHLFCFLWKGFTSDFLSEFQRELNSAVLKDMRSNKDNISITVLAVDITRKESEYKRCTNAYMNLLYSVIKFSTLTTMDFG